MTTFGYTVEAPTPWPELLQLAQELDQRSNFDSFWIADSLTPNGPLDDPKLETWTALAAVAHATSRIRLGVHVSGLPYRHPYQVFCSHQTDQSRPVMIRKKPK